MQEKDITEKMLEKYIRKIGTLPNIGRTAE